MFPRLLSLLVRLLAATWRVQQPPWPVPDACVVAFWHGELLPMVALHRDRGFVGLASRSRDGALIAAVLTRLGFRVVRGSSSEGGGDALFALREALRDGKSPAFAVDGPRGPAGRVAPGAAALAELEGVAVVFGHVEARGWRARSWDRFLVPWPFARVVVHYGVWRPGEGTLAGAMGTPSAPPP
ncbi:MAG: DUF374 domain-containing protein [Myxococcales bacterium]|nr:DUF374 domain-containing protein [Myxococcales bacterium]